MISYTARLLKAHMLEKDHMLGSIFIAKNTDRTSNSTDNTRLFNTVNLKGAIFSIFVQRTCQF